MPDQQHITDGKVVTMQYALTNAQGVVVREASGTPVSYVHGAGVLFARLEQALEGHAVGDIVTARLLPDDAFGKRNIELLQEVLCALQVSKERRVLATLDLPLETRAIAVPPAACHDARPFRPASCAHSGRGASCAQVDVAAGVAVATLTRGLKLSRC